MKVGVGWYALSLFALLVFFFESTQQERDTVFRFGVCSLKLLDQLAKFFDLSRVRRERQRRISGGGCCDREEGASSYMKTHSGLCH
ncbi:hypothetical protein BCR43DRAFT_497949 [Syncephalastrum racemosum]|uniref:Secreted protein n=1 Tax=Syncephalastrum racemosum TaxID=13706 RepID=A0A1X2H330_SYNRA|nr:hypothetical protein BCR43DRAFT_497949 [Syncephalastrum racemosum]